MFFLAKKNFHSKMFTWNLLEDAPWSLPRSFSCMIGSVIIKKESHFFISCYMMLVTDGKEVNSYWILNEAILHKLRLLLICENMLVPLIYVCHCVKKQKLNGVICQENHHHKKNLILNTDSRVINWVHAN